MCRPHRNKKSRMSSRRPRKQRPDYIVCDTSKCESDDSSDVTTVISEASEQSTFAFGYATKATAPSRKYSSSSSTHINHHSSESSLFESSHKIEAIDFLTKVEILSNEAEEEKKTAAFWSQFDDDDDVKSFGCGAGTCLGVLQFSSFKQFFMCE